MTLPPEQECMPYQGYIKPEGYGYTWFRGRMHYAHRLVWELVKGPIPKGLHIDHLCRNRACINPDHLEPVTCKVNILRGVSMAAKHAVKTHCPRNHAYDHANTYVDKNRKRYCRTCHTMQTRIRYWKKRGKDIE